MACSATAGVGLAAVAVLGMRVGDVCRPSARAQQYRSLAPALWKQLFEVLDLGLVVDHDLRRIRIPGHEVLMVGLCGVKAGVGFNLRDDGLLERMGGVQLRNVGLGDVLL